MPLSFQTWIDDGRFPNALARAVAPPQRLMTISATEISTMRNLTFFAYIGQRLKAYTQCAPLRT